MKEVIGNIWDYHPKGQGGIQKEDAVETFWAKWYGADELDRVKLVETLTLPSPKIKPRELYEHHAAELINSYLEDLAEYLEGLR